VRAAPRRSRFARLRFGRGFERKLERARTYLSAREQMREYSTRCYALLRLYVLEAGARLAARGLIDAAEQVFMLWPDELVAIGEAGALSDELRATLELRTKYYRGYRDFPAPNEFGAGVSQLSADTVDGARVLRGLGCSAGVVEGTVRVVQDLDEVHLLRPGEVLVTRFTDPGWTPTFGVIRAVVTEVGGLLSHAAVIGREYGIPAVLNLPGATRHLRTGDRVRVDGGRGTVELLEQESS
jgi:phosphohistidine swiveling domain-containing protein